MLKQTSGTSASLPQKAATGYNPEQPFLPVFCSEGIPGAGNEGSPSSGVFSHSYMLFWIKAGLSTLLLHSSFKFWLKPFPALTTRKSLDKEKGRQFCLYNDIIAHSESPMLNSHLFCSWSFCSILKEALGCLDTCLSSRGLLE